MALADQAQLLCLSAVGVGYIAMAVDEMMRVSVDRSCWAVGCPWVRACMFPRRECNFSSAPKFVFVSVGPYLCCGMINVEGVAGAVAGTSSRPIAAEACRRV